MKRRIYFLTSILSVSLVLFSSCQKQKTLQDVPSEENTEKPSRNFVEMPERQNIIPGILYVKVSDDTQKNMLTTPSGVVSLRSLPSKMSSTLRSVGTTSVEPLFPTDPRYEERHKAAGLDKWYVIRYDEDTDPLEAKIAMLGVPEIVEADVEYRMTMGSFEATPLSESELPTLPREKDLPFNDPKLKDQWHYNNTGTEPFQVEGADVNLFEAWKTTTGTPNVIVSVHDGGIDAEHEDLAQSMWVNADEIPKNGIDDDHNGYVDDYHGYSFVTYMVDPLKPGEIEPDSESHGTHVAGTVAARNNNGIGVCGVAGGNGTPESGVRLMSVAIFRRNIMINGKVRPENGDAAKTYVYAADNGAVISQNSWGYDYPGPGGLSAPLRTAIDYFIKYAGCDKKGNQRPDSPMKGGIVIFAAGNEDHDYEAFPGAYEKVLAVSAIGPDFVKSWFTNRGAWVDIAAPGGDQDRSRNSRGAILSCLSPKIAKYAGKKYGYMQGTSMACPHVSGIAALAVSKLGGPGFTSDQLFKILTGATLPLDINAYNPVYPGRLGSGYIDAARVFAKNQNKAPQKAELKLKKAGFLDLELEWAVPADDDDKTPLYYELYQGSETLTESNYSTVGVLFPRINNGGKKAGETITKKVERLSHTTSYHFALVAVDRWGLKSPVSFLTASTLTNHPPAASGYPTETVAVSNLVEEHFSFKVSDPDGHSWKFKLEGNSEGVSVSETKDGVDVTIWPVKAVGNYKVKIVFTDELGSSSSIEIPYEVYEYIAPKFTAEVKDLVIGLNDPNMTLPLGDMYHYNKRFPLKVTANSTDGSVASAKVSEDNKLTITAHKQGSTVINLNATDGKKSADPVSFKVRVVKDSTAEIYAIYPVPAKDHLYFFVSKDLGDVEVRVLDILGREVMKKKLPRSFNGVLDLSVKKLAPGAYRLFITTPKGVEERSFIKR